MKRTLLAGLATIALVTGAAAPAHGAPPGPTPGAPGIGDPYYPLAGNGGYDVQRYRLSLAYDPATDVLSGRAQITARATQALSSFNLDLDGLTVRQVRVNGALALFSRTGGELTIRPGSAIADRALFTVVIVYDGIPETIDDLFGLSGFLHTDDGTLVAGQPFGAATWYPVNDHPLDTASYLISISVPDGLTAVANGVLAGRHSRNGTTTWIWSAAEPMASYLTTMTIGEFDLRSYRADGVRYWDAVDPDLYDPVFEPRTGSQSAMSQQADLSYKRLTTTIDVPADGDQTLTFWIRRDTEFAWDHFFVEAHTPGTDDWTTLPEASGITSGSTGASCPIWLGMHPFLEHYQTDNGDGSCASTGTTGEWNAATGASDGYESWSVDLSGYAGTAVEISLTYASDDSVQAGGISIDDIDAPGTAHDTSFEDDGDELDGWTVPGAPEGSEPNANDWIAGTSADGPAGPGAVIDASFARQPEILSFLSDYFGPYPFTSAGGIVDDDPRLTFALETQTRSVYSLLFFTDSVSGDSVVVHENAHQWFGDDVPLGRWQDIWLNEGFATYAEWLWSEHEGLGTPDEIFDFYMTVIPPDDPFWSLPIGDPGPDALFDPPVYLRGAMTLHALRLEVGDATFFQILRSWARLQSGDNVTTPEFVRHTERFAGAQLDDLFDTWLYSTTKPPFPGDGARVGAAVSSAPPVARAEIARWSGT